MTHARASFLRLGVQGGGGPTSEAPAVPGMATAAEQKLIHHT